MSEQETELDTAIQQLQQVETFNQYAETLMDVLNKSTKVNKPNEARKRVIEIAETIKTELMANSPEFKSIMDQRRREAKKKADESRAIHKAMMREAESKAKMVRADTMMKADSARRHADQLRSGVDEWVAKTRFKIVDPEELEKKLDDKMGCPNPKCEDYGETRRNIMNDVATCMRCYHRLVPKSEFKGYNRKYWRRFNKKKKKASRKSKTASFRKKSMISSLLKS